MKLVKCESCQGTGRAYCCSDYYCPGDRECYKCDGKGKVLSPEDKKRKEELLKLLEYK